MTPLVIETGWYLRSIKYPDPRFNQAMRRSTQ
jgi:hypothetical protein